MELRAYLRILIRHWWLVLLAFAITYGATLALTFRQEPMYAVTARTVVKPSTSFTSDRSIASGIDVLSRAAEIGNTYSEVATSRLIKGQAAQELGLTPDQRARLSVSSGLVAGTNVLEITVEGPRPALVRNFANTVTARTIAYTGSLYPTYELELLDQATLPDEPVRPNRPLNFTLGALMGLVLGAGLAFLAEYLRAPLEHLSSFGIIDGETGVYNQRYFMLRLREEVSRARRTDHPLSIALMNVDRQGAMDGVGVQVRREALRRVALLLKPYLRDEDIMAHLDDSLFVFLLPNMPEEEVTATIERMQTRIASTPLELERSGALLNLQCITGVIVDQDKSVDPDGLLAEAARALKEAETTTNGQVYHFSENSNQAQYNGVKALHDA